jgi:hypothetical protein
MCQSGSSVAVGVAAGGRWREVAVGGWRLALTASTASMSGMTFIYSIGEVEDGNTSDETPFEGLPALLEAGTINDDTMIYYEGLEDWYSFPQVKDIMMEAIEGGGEAEEDGGLSSADWAEAIADLDLADAKEMCVEAGLPVRPCMRPCIVAGAPRPVLPLPPLRHASI